MDRNEKIQALRNTLAPEEFEKWDQETELERAERLQKTFQLQHNKDQYALQAELLRANEEEKARLEQEQAEMKRLFDHENDVFDRESALRLGLPLRRRIARQLAGAKALLGMSARMLWTVTVWSALPLAIANIIWFGARTGLSEAYYSYLLAGIPILLVVMFSWKLGWLSRPILLVFCFGSILNLNFGHVSVPKNPGEIIKITGTGQPAKVYDLSTQNIFPAPRPWERVTQIFVATPGTQPEQVFRNGVVYSIILADASSLYVSLAYDLELDMGFVASSLESTEQALQLREKLRTEIYDQVKLVTDRNQKLNDVNTISNNIAASLKDRRNDLWKLKAVDIYVTASVGMRMKKSALVTM